MKYAVVSLTGPHQGYIIKRAILARRNRIFVGSYQECADWIAGLKAVLADRYPTPVSGHLRLVATNEVAAAASALPTG